MKMKITLEDIFIKLNNSNDEHKKDVAIMFGSNNKSTDHIIITTNFYEYYWKYLTGELLIKKVEKTCEGDNLLIVILEG